ncbi:lysophospholipid acyltransferase family protein [Zavarzinia compransoris]|uniref:Acyltransferase n=1 Tax=Zavarzinia compransoris TaxID=1264899 RepID=A0A317DZ32_9PROT|nr:lysophospholipid acyltransferase family protein [Zavarzinia compransoris]PWR18303.1 acyltransferase [Zavarzinia compransoris]TDP43640.1 acyltransferase-like protein [Zavarzinia compransoris]
MTQAENTAGIEAALAYRHPPAAQMRRAMAVPRAWFHPEFLGLKALDLSRPALFVGNHTLFGLTDAPLMIEHLYTRHGAMLRGLGDRGHFKVPFWGEFLGRYGMVLGSPEICSALMRAGRHILVFPGGAREVMRRRGEAYKLIWKQRTGFARLAIAHGYDIIPFGVVGPDESYRILFDADDMTRPGWRRDLMERSGLMKLTRGGDFLPPAVLGLGPTLIPRPQRYYFGFGDRIPTGEIRGRQDDKDAVWSLRETVAAAVEGQIDRLRHHREQDRPRTWSRLRRWLAPLQQ